MFYPMLIAVAFSDLHAYKFQLFNKDNSRLNNTLSAFRFIAGVAEFNKVPLLFCGDLFHTPKEVDNETLEKVLLNYMGNIEDNYIPMFSISGNHDQSEKNGYDYRSPSYLRSMGIVFKNFRLLDYLVEGLMMGEDTQIWGIPYMNSEDEILKCINAYRPWAKEHKDKYKILMMHGDVLGAKDHNGLELYDGTLFKKGVDKFFKEWDLVLYGHIHKPQSITKKVHMLGSPIHQISSDKGDMGYWLIFNDRPPKFVGLAGYPKFVHLEKGQIAPDDKNYYIPFEREEAIEEVEQGDFNINHSRTKLAKKYMRVKGIKSKIKKKELIHILNSIE